MVAVERMLKSNLSGEFYFLGSVWWLSVDVCTVECGNGSSNGAGRLCDWRLFERSAARRLKGFRG